MAWIKPRGNYYYLWEKVKDPETGEWKNKPTSTGIRVSAMGKIAADKFCADHNEDRARVKLGLTPMHKEVSQRQNWWGDFKKKMTDQIDVGLGAKGQKKARFVLDIFERLFRPAEMTIETFKKAMIGQQYVSKRLAGQPETHWCGSKTKVVNRPVMLSTVKTEISYLSPLFELATDQWSEETGIPLRNPFKGVKISSTLPGVKEKKDDPKYLPFETIQAFFTESRRRHGLAGEFLMKVFYYIGGSRLSEGQYIRTEDVNLAGKKVLIKGTKTARAWRWVDIPDSFMPDIEAYMATARPGFLCPHKKGGIMPTSTIQHRAKKAFKAVGVPWAHIHTLRHCYTSHRLENGDNPLAVRDSVGHKNLSTTNIYAHRSQKRQEITLGAAQRAA